MTTHSVNKMITYQIEEIATKHRLLMKQDKEGLTPEEEQRLKEIETILNGIVKDVLLIEKAGAVVEEQKGPQKPKSLLSVEDRKARAEEIYQDGKAAHKNDKEIRRDIVAELGVSVTYANKIIKR